MNFERNSNPIKTLDIGNTRFVNNGDEFNVIFPTPEKGVPFHGLYPNGYIRKCIAMKDEKIVFKFKKARYTHASPGFHSESSGAKAIRQVEYYLAGVGYSIAEMENNSGIWKTIE